MEESNKKSIYIFEYIYISRNFDDQQSENMNDNLYFLARVLFLGPETGPHAKRACVLGLVLRRCV